jgi:hypothetical protein
MVWITLQDDIAGRHTVQYIYFNQFQTHSHLYFCLGPGKWFVEPQNQLHLKLSTGMFIIITIRKKTLSEINKLVPNGNKILRIRHFLRHSLLQSRDVDPDPDPQFLRIWIQIQICIKVKNRIWIRIKLKS